ncbi:MAG: STAS domain-containing protein [Ignavibacteriales bacterium]|nr:STAS domain-containing protein [Ignavibacteriales bacterium]MCF8305553.1 STAS domain-containing protein [Ignavibacteriales bacterium]MCF8315275.1 STAS domain-containing protein [Ignavibacteriales bacterium]MCF8436833.1 STAS domain-containing protein [Ignavibacteriales bacterium]
MNVSEERQDSHYILSLAGRLDASTSNAFEEKFLSLIDEGETNILLNFSQLDYISSSGLRVLLLGAKKIKTKSGKISLCNLKSHIMEVFEIAGFLPLFKIYDSLDEALKA